MGGAGRDVINYTVTFSDCILRISSLGTRLGIRGRSLLPETLHGRLAQSANSCKSPVGGVEYTLRTVSGNAICYTVFIALYIGSKYSRPQLQVSLP